MSDDSKTKIYEGKMADESAMGNPPPPSTEPNCRNKFDEEVEAVILFPSLGAPQILPSDAKECTIIIATNMQGSRILSDPCKGAVAVNHHLRLANLYTDKSKFQVDVKDHKLYGLDDKLAEGDEARKLENRKKAKEYIEIWVLSFNAQSNLLRLSNAVIGRLSSDARELLGEFNQYFAITLKLGSMYFPPDANAQSWYWIVTASHDRIQEDKQCERPILTDEKQLYQPGDRLLAKKFAELGLDESTKGFLVDEKTLFEVSSIDEYGGPRTDMGFLRVQLWHPVMTKPAGTAFKFGHLTDTQINVRQASLARSQARVIESPEAEGRQNEPIGPRVAHASQSFKALIDKMAGKADILLLTGDYIDFNRNLQPSATEGANIGQLWQKFNVFTNALKPNGIYRRGLDYIYLYSLVLYALRSKKLPAFMVTGNHEGYQLPYGISPRVDDDAMAAMGSTYVHSRKPYEAELRAENGGDGTVHPYEGNETISNFSAALKVYVEREKEAYDALQIADTDYAADPTEINENKRNQAKAYHDDTVRQLRELHEGSVELASQFHSKKATECIPSDHNLTIYEACLAFGPTYGQTLTSHNFRNHQLNLVHWLFTPFTDLNVYPGCADLLGYGAEQVVTLLGWGPDERLLATSTPEVVIKAKFPKLENGMDQRGPGFLPYALHSINQAQLDVLHFAYHTMRHEKRKTCSQTPTPVPIDFHNKWIVASHFTIASYEDKVPIGVAGGFVPDNTPQTAMRPRFDATGAQYNVFNAGGCELGLRDYLNVYTNIGSALPGRVNMHFSGHSHRCGIYTLGRNGDAVRLTCRAPGLLGDIGQLQDRHAGTKFIVGNTAGPMGKQGLNGYRPQKGVPMAECFVDSERRSGKWNAFLDGWLTRPPSGLIADPERDELEYVVTADEARNQKPRLAVMLDYRHVMTEVKPVTIRSGNFREGFAVRLSDEVEAMKCFKLDDVVLWVFKEGETGREQLGGTKGGIATMPSEPVQSQKPTGQWQKFAASLVPDLQRPGHYTLRFQTPGAVYNALKVTNGGAPQQESEQPSVDQSSDLAITQKMPPQDGNPGVDYSWNERSHSIAAFLGIGLTTPQAPKSAPWHEVRCDEHWIFPVHVMSWLRVNVHLFRDWGELGEVPNWVFLAKYFGDKGYIAPEKAINPEKG